MAKKKNRTRSLGGEQTASTLNTKFKAPTPGLKDAHFTQGTSMATADFSETQSKISRYVGSKAKGVVGARAIMNLEHPNIMEPEEPFCVTKKKIAQQDGKDSKVDSSDPVLSDALYAFVYKTYMVT